MKLKKISIITTTLILLSQGVYAENKNHDWAEKAAKAYEIKAEKSIQTGNKKAAKIYLEMAKIKREAGDAAKLGKEYSWDKYHKLEGKLRDALKQNSTKKESTNPSQCKSCKH